MNDYEAKQEARRERYLARAEAAEQEATDNFNGPNGRILSGMMGEPVKVGHHSERRHRRLIEKADREMRKGCEAMKKAKHYERKAASVGKGGVSADDPDAINKLRAKLQRRKENQDTMKAVNRIIRSKPKNEMTAAKIAKLTAIGLSETAACASFQPDFCGRIGFPGYALQNNNANIKRIEKRITDLESATQRPEQAKQYGNIEYREEDNRVRLIFPGKPPKETRDILKRHGFRWAPSAGAWQRQNTANGRAAASAVLATLES